MATLTKSIGDVAHRLENLITEHKNLLNSTTKNALDDVANGGLLDATVNSIYKAWIELFAKELIEFGFPQLEESKDLDTPQP